MNTKPIIDVTAGILRRGKKILIAQRSEVKHESKWEFPGGKTEDSETPRKGLKRELKEELDLDCEIGDLFYESYWESSEKTIYLQTYEVTSFTGEEKALSHAELRWVMPVELKDYNFLPADIPVVEHILYLYTQK